MKPPNPKPPAPPLEALRALVSRHRAARAAVEQQIDGYRAMRTQHAHLALQMVDLENRMAAIEQFFRAQNTKPAPARRRRARR